MDYSKLSDSDLIALKNKDYSKLSNEALMLLKGEKEKTENKSENENKSEPIKISKKELDLSKDYTPSGLAKRSANNIAALIRMPMYGEDFDTAKQNSRINQIIAEKQHPYLTGSLEFATDLGGYSLLPILGGKGAFIKNALVQGGVPGAAEAMKREGSPVGGAAMGTGIAGLLQTLPYVGKGVNVAFKPVSYLANKALEGITGLKPTTIKQVIKPNSKALDLDDNQAQNLLMNTTEAVRNNYKSLLNQKGNIVGNLLKELPENKKFKAEELFNLYDSILNSYSLSGNQAVNPARNATTKELSKIKELLEGDGTKRFDEFSQSIKDLEFPKGYLDTVTNRYKNTYHKKVLDNLNNDIEFAQRNFNKNILDKLRKNPEILQNPEMIAELEKEVGRYAKFADDDLNNMFYNKFYEAVGKGDILEPGQNYINPKELFDINKNINNMIDWDKPGSESKNKVLEQLYLANAKKISDLSPELKAANKAYSDLMDFQKNEGIRRILNNSNNIDTASTTLKNYNSTVSKGNTNRNIQDLERILTENGYSPFLNDIDDVNAAMDLLTQSKTGKNLWGNETIAKGLANIGFRGIRKINQFKNSKLAEKMHNINEYLKPLTNIRGMGAKAGANMLYGGVEYNDYQDN